MDQHVRLIPVSVLVRGISRVRDFARFNRTRLAGIRVAATRQRSLERGLAKRSKSFAVTRC